MKTNVYNQEGALVEAMDLPESVFGLKINPDLVHQVFLAQSANARQVLAHTKGRGEVRGGGKKPWKQKGTGRARHASIRSPIWKGGGVAFGPTKERNFTQKINKKMKRKALFMVLSSKVKDKEFAVIESLTFTDLKTKNAAKAFNVLSQHLENYKKTNKKQDSVILVTVANDKNIQRVSANLPFVHILSVDSLNVGDLLSNKYLVVSKEAIPLIAKTYKI